MRPTVARLNPWPAIGGEEITVDFVRSLAYRGIVWSMVIIPLDDHGQLIAKRFAPNRNQWQLGEVT